MDLIDKVYEIVELLKNSPVTQEFLKVKKEVEEDKELQKLFLKVKSTEDIYSLDFTELKRQLLTNEKVKKYKKLENDFYFLSLSINKELKKINNKKSCGL